MKLNTKRVLLVGLVFFSISLLNNVHDNTTNIILTQEFNISQSIKGFIMAIDNILALFMLPLFGKLSDKCTSRLGKRKPFVIAGTIGGCIFLLLFPIALQYNSLAMFITFICLYLVAMATYRSAGVSIMSDVTIKPLRSKANAIINLCGAGAFVAGALITMFLFKDPVNGVRPLPLYWMYIAYVGIALIALLIYTIFVDEKKMTAERELLEEQLQLEEEDIIEDGVNVKLTKDQWKSFVLIFVSICLWTFGYNAATTFYGQYAKEILLIADGGFVGPTLLAGISGMIAYIPTGIIASKIGRRKTILIGFGGALLAFLVAMLAKSQTAMMALFVLVGIAQAMIIVNTLPMVVEFSNKNTIGQFTGYYYISTQSASALTPLLAGLIQDATKTGSTGALGGIGGSNGLLTLFPYSALFVLLAIIPMLFVKHGDSKPIPPKDKLEALGADD